MAAVVLGSKTVEALVMVIQDFITRGLRVYSPAQRGHNPGQPSVSKETLLNENEVYIFMVLTR